MRTKTQECLRGLGALTGAVLGEMLVPRLRADGLLAGVKGTVEPPGANGAVDAGRRERAPCLCSPFQVWRSDAPAVFLGRLLLCTAIASTCWPGRMVGAWPERLACRGFNFPLLCRDMGPPSTRLVACVLYGF